MSVFHICQTILLVNGEPLGSEGFKSSKTSQSLCELGIPNYSLFCSSLNVGAIFRPTPFWGKKLKSYKGDQPYHIWERVKSFPF